MVPTSPGGRAGAAGSRAASARRAVAVPDGDHLLLDHRHLRPADAHDAAPRGVRQDRGAAAPAGKPALHTTTAQAVARIDPNHEGTGMKMLWRLLWMCAAWAALIAAAVTLARAGIYGVALFAFLPVVMRALVGWSRPVATIRQASMQGGLTAAIGCLFFIVIGLEGLICMVMALPLAVPLGMLGSCLSFLVRNRRMASRTTAALLLPFGLVSAVYDIAA